MNATHNGWTFNPNTEEWQKRTGPSTWLVVKAPFTSPPRF